MTELTAVECTVHDGSRCCTLYVQQCVQQLFNVQFIMCTALIILMLRLRDKVIAFGAHPEKTLHNYFTSFLSRLSVTCHGSKKTEVCF